MREWVAPLSVVGAMIYNAVRDKVRLEDKGENHSQAIADLKNDHDNLRHQLDELLRKREKELAEFGRKLDRVNEEGSNLESKMQVAVMNTQLSIQQISERLARIEERQAFVISELSRRKE